MKGFVAYAENTDSWRVIRRYCKVKALQQGACKLNQLYLEVHDPPHLSEVLRA